jgi:type II secretory pathway pseudopilin PulG
MRFFKPFHSGFGLLEVTIAAGLMGGLAMVFMNIMEQQTKTVQEMEMRQEIDLLLEDIRSILNDRGSCQASLKGLDPLEAELTTLIQRYPTKDGGTEEKGKYSTTDKEKFAHGLTIDRLELSGEDDPNVGIVQGTNYGDTNLVVTFNRGDKGFSSRILTRKIKVSFELDSTDKISSCSAMASSARGMAITILDPTREASLNNLSGDDACSKRGLKCAHTQSLNFAAEVSGDISLAQSCPVAYNTDIPGVEKGLPRGNTHPCSVKLGLHPTFKLSSSTTNLTCMGLFSAVCY